MTEIIRTILCVVLFVILLWFTYTIVNIYVTIMRCRKQDHSLTFCFNTAGKIVYILLTILFVVCYVGGVGVFIYGLIKNDPIFYQNGLNVATLLSIIYGYFLSTIVLIGRKNMMVGRMMIDYRKMKKANFNYNHKMSFVYAQKDYSFSTRFVDTTQLKKAITR